VRRVTPVTVDLIDRVRISGAAYFRWEALCAVTLSQWHDQGLIVRPEDCVEERAEIRDGKLVLYASAPPGRVEMTLGPEEWVWADRVPSAN
jgi:hypothetical protein